jgi:hypothetical protein
LSYLDLSFTPESDRLKEQHQTLNTMATLEQTLRQSHDWAIDRIEQLHKKDIEAAYAIQSEFSEWLNPNIEDHDIFSLEYIGD